MVGIGNLWSAGTCREGRAKRFVPFMEGPRSCAGQALASMNLTATLALLYGRFSFRLADEVRPRTETCTLVTCAVHVPCPLVAARRALHGKRIWARLAISDACLDRGLTLILVLCRWAGRRE